ncbi:MAG: histidinol phosphate phosphatase [Polyangiaceae bacterium]|jgi:histidinol-phosphatase|nr:histidinol phosphate phosphatase [Polyangiaceae bacterium]MBK8941892.1 histidinol phosphate phosphatase [Polyangiaceae bacterium]
MSGSLLEAAIELAKVTGDVALEHYRRHHRGERLTVEVKADGSPVSSADRSAELAARAFIERYFPTDGVLGEELGEHRPGAPRRWCIDPIDGTKSFLAGAPLWGSLVALVEGEHVLAGASYFPVTGELIAAVPGGGCVTAGVPVGASSIADLAQAVVVTTDERFPDAPECAGPWRELAARARVARTWGDCFGYYLVATGRAELMTDGKLSPWDAACFLPIIEESGGVFSDWDGRRTAFGRGVIATNTPLAGALRRALGVPEGGAPT